MIYYGNDSRQQHALPVNEPRLKSLPVGYSFLVLYQQHFYHRNPDLVDRTCRHNNIIYYETRKRLQEQFPELYARTEPLKYAPLRYDILDKSHMEIGGKGLFPK
jgi:hypothetical protein